MSKKILIIEQEQDFVEALSKQFEPSGYTLVHACDGQEALCKVKEEFFDLIILEIIIPKVDGMHVLTQLKKEMKLKIPIVVLTHLGHEDDKKMAMDLGAYSYFVKAQTPLTQLLTHIETI